MKKTTSVLLVAVFVPLYGWDFWEAVGNLLGLPGFYAALGIADSVPWVLLWAGVVMPLAVLVAAVVITHRFTSPLSGALVFVTGWALVAALSMSFAEIEQGWRAATLLSLAG
jgi:hypothetical protein